MFYYAIIKSEEDGKKCKKKKSNNNLQTSPLEMLLILHFKDGFNLLTSK